MPRKRRNSDGSRLFDSDVCAFCGTDEDNELLYGKFIVTEDVTLHNNCMFFASALCQANEDEGESDVLSGFLPEDIEVELRRGKKLFCSYCRKRGATIGCCEVKCKKSFHLPCGLQSGSLHQFFGSFSSYCRAHAPRQKPVNIPESLICHICCEDLIKSNQDEYLYSPCCKNSCFHKICLQKYALSAGIYFFKCPLCKNSKEFVKEMQTHGICIPDKDASWELEENAFQDLLIKPDCDAPSCICPKGKNYSSKKRSGWTLIPCSYCGSHARHINCRDNKSTSNTWICGECENLEGEITKRKLSSKIVIVEKLNEANVSSAHNNDNKIHTSSVDCLPSSSSNSSFCPFVSIHVSQKVSPAKKIISKDTYQNASPLKRNISYDVDQKVSPVKGNISFDVDQKEFPAKKNIFFDVDEEESQAKKDFVCDVDPMYLMVSPSTDVYNVVNGHSSDDSELNSTKESLLKMKLSSSEVESCLDPYIRDTSNVVKGFKDIKNLSSSSSVLANRTKNTAKDVDKKLKVVIKRKTGNKQKFDKKLKVDSSCGTPNHFCMMKYFGRECCQYRL